MYNNLVSIIIPMYNSSKYIEETIQSIFFQTYNNFEIIIVDDGSEDDSIEIVKKYESFNFLIFKQPHKGACAARNLGFKHSKGKYIKFLDSDDILSSNYLQNVLSCFNSDPNCNLVTTQLKIFKNTIEDSFLVDSKLYKNYNTSSILVYEMAYYWQSLQLSSWICTRQLLEVSNLWNESLIRNQDGEILIRLLLNCNKVVFCKDTFTFYRNRENSLSKSKSYDSYKSLLKSYILY